MIHSLNPGLVYSVLTIWLNCLLKILQIFHNKRWCWVLGSKQLALPCHLGLGSPAPFLSNKGHLSSGNSQDISELQKSITALCFGKKVSFWYI